MLIGMAIDTSGQFPEEDAKRFVAFGREIKRRFGKSLGETDGSGREVILNISSRPSNINHVMIMEDITKGERVRSFEIAAWLNGKWVTMAKGISIGHKSIQRFKIVNTDKIRLLITKSSAPPIIKKMAVYYVHG